MQLPWCNAKFKLHAVHTSSDVQVAHSVLHAPQDLFPALTKLPMGHWAAVMQPYLNQIGVAEVDRHVEHTVESLKHTLQGLWQGMHSPVTRLGKLLVWHCETHLLFYKKSNAVTLQLRQLVVVF